MSTSTVCRGLVSEFGQSHFMSDPRRVSDVDVDS
jgi:hypothetical protein